MNNKIKRYIDSLEDPFLGIINTMTIFNISLKEFLLYYYDIDKNKINKKHLENDMLINENFCIIKINNQYKLIYEVGDYSVDFNFYNLLGEKIFTCESDYIFADAYSYQWSYNYNNIDVSYGRLSGYLDSFKNGNNIINYIERKFFPILNGLS